MLDIELHGLLHRLGGTARLYALGLLLSLTVGYSVGVYYLYISSGYGSDGVTENYLGNANDEEAEEMKFKMPEAKLLTVIHSHILSYALIFGLTGALLLISSVPRKLKRLLIIEPFVMMLITFGGIYLLWAGYTWVAPLIIVSGTLLTLGFYVCTGCLALNIMRGRLR